MERITCKIISGTGKYGAFYNCLHCFILRRRKRKVFFTVFGANNVKFSYNCDSKSSIGSVGTVVLAADTVMLGCSSDGFLVSTLQKCVKESKTKKNFCIHRTKLKRSFEADCGP